MDAKLASISLSSRVLWKCEVWRAGVGGSSAFQMKNGSSAFQAEYMWKGGTRAESGRRLDDDAIRKNPCPAHSSLLAANVKKLLTKECNFQEWYFLMFGNKTECSEFAESGSLEKIIRLRAERTSIL
jgi:hypothetical protein